MSDKELLRDYRVLSLEGAMLETQLNTTLPTDEDDGEQRRRIRELQSLQAENVRKRSGLSGRFEQVVVRAPNARQQQILRQYYGIGMTDRAIADSIGCSAKAVNKLRNKFIHDIEETRRG